MTETNMTSSIANVGDQTLVASLAAVTLSNDSASQAISNSMIVSSNSATTPILFAGELQAPDIQSSLSQPLRAALPNQVSRPSSSCSVRSGSLSIRLDSSSSTALDTQDGESTTSTATSLVDEAILSAVRSSRDRVFFIQYEREMAVFVKDPTRLKWDLPLMNAYQRLLVHRCADQFNLQHQLDPVTKVVTLAKTPDTRLPAVRMSQRAMALIAERDSLTPASPFTVTPPTSTGTASPSIVPPTGFRIMKRDTTNSPKSILTPAASASGSNSDSESSSVKKDRRYMTIEERAAAYKAARERIFGDSQILSNEQVKTDMPPTKTTTSTMSAIKPSDSKKKTGSTLAPSHSNGSLDESPQPSRIPTNRCNSAQLYSNNSLSTTHQPGISDVNHGLQYSRQVPSQPGSFALWSPSQSNSQPHAQQQRLPSLSHLDHNPNAQTFSYASDMRYAGHNVQPGFLYASSSHPNANAHLCAKAPTFLPTSSYTGGGSIVMGQGQWVNQLPNANGRSHRNPPSSASKMPLSQQGPDLDMATTDSTKSLGHQPQASTLANSTSSSTTTSEPVPAFHVGNTPSGSGSATWSSPASVDQRIKQALDNDQFPALAPLSPSPSSLTQSSGSTAPQGAWNRGNKVTEPQSVCYVQTPPPSGPMQNPQQQQQRQQHHQQHHHQHQQQQHHQHQQPDAYRNGPYTYPVVNPGVGVWNQQAVSQLNPSAAAAQQYQYPQAATMSYPPRAPVMVPNQQSFANPAPGYHTFQPQAVWPLTCPTPSAPVMTGTLAPTQRHKQRTTSSSNNSTHSSSARSTCQSKDDSASVSSTGSSRSTNKVTSIPSTHHPLPVKPAWLSKPSASANSPLLSPSLSTADSFVPDTSSSSS